MIYNRWGGLIWKYQGDLYGGPDDRNNFVQHTLYEVIRRNGCDGTVAVQYSGSGASFSFAWDNGIPSVTDTARNNFVQHTLYEVIRGDPASGAGHL